MQPAPFYADLAGAPEGEMVHWVHATDGVRVRLAHWHPPGAKGTVLLCPGRTEYIEKYGAVVGEFTQRGLAVVVNDWRGQGLSDRALPNRLLGHVAQFSDYQHDVAAMMAYLQAHALPQPVHVVAHSMAGCIILRALMHGLQAQTVTFSAPMWGIVLPPHMRAAAWAVTAALNGTALRDSLAPGAEAATMVDIGDFASNKLTGDAAQYDRMIGQMHDIPDFGLAGPTIAWLHGALREMRHLARLPAPDIPCLTFLGTNEAITDPRRITRRMARWPDGRLEILPQGRHEVMMETSDLRGRFFAQTTAHMGMT
ncbi:MAG: alpha/beta hydrolase [Pseudomonadota bacterium]